MEKPRHSKHVKVLIHHHHHYRHSPQRTYAFPTAYISPTHSFCLVMATILDSIPLLPLPYDTVLFPSRKLQFSASNRPDVIAIIAEYYNRAFTSTNAGSKSTVIGCVPLRSPYLNGDGQRLIEDGKDTPKRTPKDGPLKQDDLFNYGVLATIGSVEGKRTGKLQIVVEGLQRFKLEEIVQEKPYLAAKVKTYADEGTRYTHIYPAKEGDAHIVDSRHGRSCCQRCLCQSQAALT